MKDPKYSKKKNVCMVASQNQYKSAYIIIHYYFIKINIEQNLKIKKTAGTLKVKDELSRDFVSVQPYCICLSYISHAIFSSI